MIIHTKKTHILMNRTQLQGTTVSIKLIYALPLYEKKITQYYMLASQCMIAVLILCLTSCSRIFASLIALARFRNSLAHLRPLARSFTTLTLTTLTRSFCDFARSLDMFTTFMFAARTFMFDAHGYISVHANSKFGLGPLYDWIQKLLRKFNKGPLTSSKAKINVRAF